MKTITPAQFYCNVKKAGGFVGEAKTFLSKENGLSYPITPGGIYNKLSGKVEKNAVNPESLVSFADGVTDGFYGAMHNSSQVRKELASPTSLMSKQERENHGDDVFHAIRSFKSMLGSYLKDKNAQVRIGYATPAKENFEVRILGNNLKNDLVELDSFNIEPVIKDDSGATFSQKLFKTVENLLKNPE